MDPKDITIISDLAFLKAMWNNPDRQWIQDPEKRSDCT